jgi:hypothetical protein
LLRSLFLDGGSTPAAIGASPTRKPMKARKVPKFGTEWSSFCLQANHFGLSHKPVQEKGRRQVAAYGLRAVHFKGR